MNDFKGRFTTKQCIIGKPKTWGYERTGHRRQQKRTPSKMQNIFREKEERNNQRLHRKKVTDITKDYKEL
jgi:hypothetical protein